MKSCEINPHLRYGRLHTTNKLPEEFSYCYDCRLFYFVQGGGQAEINGRNYHFSKNHAIFIPPGGRYRFTLREPPAMLVFNFDPSCRLAHLTESLGTATAMTFEPEKVLRYPLPDALSKPFCRFAPRLYEPLKQCADEFLMEDPYYREAASALLKYALIELIRAPREAASETVTAVTEYIRRHYADTSLDNKRIAGQFNYHPYHLSTLMKRATGKTLNAFLVDHRIKIAKDLLITTDLDVNTVAWKCGFNSTAYFIKQFKAHVGTTPRQYSKNHNI